MIPREDRVTWESNCFLKVIQLCMRTHSASLWEQTMWSLSRCSRSSRSCEGRQWCRWARTPGWARPPGSIWRTTQLWRHWCLTSGEMWALCPPRSASLRLGTGCSCAVLPFSVRSLGLGPERTSFFRGTSDLLSDVQLMKTGDEIVFSEATLLNSSPFSFGVNI